MSGQVTVAEMGSCNVSPALNSQWRNGPHWHAVWPPGWDEAHWCYPTREAAQARAAEVNAIWAEYPDLAPDGAA